MKKNMNMNSGRSNSDDPVRSERSEAHPMTRPIHLFTPTPRTLDEVHVQFHDRAASVTLRSRASMLGFEPDNLLINIPCREPELTGSFHPRSRSV